MKFEINIVYSKNVSRDEIWCQRWNRGMRSRSLDAAVTMMSVRVTPVLVNAVRSHASSSATSAPAHQFPAPEIIFCGVPEKAAQARRQAPRRASPAAAAAASSSTTANSPANISLVFVAVSGNGCWPQSRWCPLGPEAAADARGRGGIWIMSVSFGEIFGGFNERQSVCIVRNIIAFSLPNFPFS